MNDLILLAILLEGPKHGYALKKKAGLFFGRPEMHNNLVYPLLKRFVDAKWVGRRSTAGKRGQTREVYALTVKGKEELLRRLRQFGEREACLENEFRLRVGLFSVLDKSSRERILQERLRGLAARDGRLRYMQETVELGDWGGEVVSFLREQIQSEEKWIARLARKATRRVKALPEKRSADRHED